MNSYECGLFASPHPYEGRCSQTMRQNPSVIGPQGCYLTGRQSRPALCLIDRTGPGCLPSVLCWAALSRPGLPESTNRA